MRGGLTLYGSLVTAVGVCGWLPYLLQQLGWISYEATYPFAFISGPILPAYLFGPGGLLANVLDSSAWNNWNATLGLLVSSLLYYALVLVPMGILLISANGHLTELRHRERLLWVCAICQALLVVAHCGLCVLGLTMLKA